MILYLHTNTRTFTTHSARTQRDCVFVCVCVMEREKFALPLILLSQSGVALNVLPLTIQSHITHTVLLDSLSHWEDKYYTSLPLVQHIHTHTPVPPLTSIYLLSAVSPLLSFQFSNSHIPLASTSLLFHFINLFFLIHSACCHLKFQKQVICVNLTVFIYEPVYALGFGSYNTLFPQVQAWRTHTYTNT